MDSLLRCDWCRHGAPSHDGSGCDVTECTCRATREQVVGSGIDAAKAEIARIWNRTAEPVGDSG